MRLRGDKNFLPLHALTPFHSLFSRLLTMKPILPILILLLAISKVKAEAVFAHFLVRIFKLINTAVLTISSPTPCNTNNPTGKTM